MAVRDLNRKREYAERPNRVADEEQLKLFFEGKAKWAALSKEDRKAILAERRKRDGLPEGKKIYKTCAEKIPNMSIKAKEIEDRLMAVSQCPRAETRYWFSIISALIQHELAHERQFMIPGVGLLHPVYVHNKRFFDYQTQSWQIYDTWLKINVKLHGELKTRFRKKYPHRPNPLDADEIKAKWAKRLSKAEETPPDEVSVDDLC